MTCREIADFLLAYIEGELPAHRRRTFEEHLAECEQCVDYIESYKATVELGKAAFQHDDEVPADVPEALVEAILAARSDRAPRKRR
jgi:anti-sigma factor RsiW